MIKMINWVLGATVFTSCSSDDNPTTPPEKALPKVSKIYSASKMTYERFVAGQWVKLYDQTRERVLSCDFRWTGDRLVSIVKDYAADSPDMRISSHSTYDLEYVEN